MYWLCHMQLNIHVYVRTPSGEAFTSPLLSVHNKLYYLPETGIAWLVPSSGISQILLLAFTEWDEAFVQ